MFSLESPHRGDSNEYTQYTIFNIKRKATLNYPKSAAEITIFNIKRKATLKYPKSAAKRLKEPW